MVNGLRHAGFYPVAAKQSGARTEDRKDFTKHTRVTRVLHPIWLYVSVTGVVVFLMLRPYYPVS